MIQKENLIKYGKTKEANIYSNSFQKWLKENDIVMYSTNNERKSVIAERFIRKLKNKVYKYMTLLSKNVYIDRLDNIVKEYNNTYHKSIKMKPADVKDNTYINFKKEVNDKNPKFKVGDHVMILMVKKLLIHFMKMNCKRLIKKNLE